MASSSAGKQLELPKRPRLLAPQDAIDDFWSKFTSKTPGKATTLIPQNQYAKRLAKLNLQQSPSTTSTASYDDAAAMCRAKVDKIVKECRRINKKYRDLHFDLESDLKLGIRDCLQSLSNIDLEGIRLHGSDFKPLSAKRVVDIFDNPRFYIDGPTANDVRQGRDGDCWLMAALCTLSNKKGLIEKLCVAHDQDVGVYGFVFHRDGEWISEIVDDFLYLTKPDYDESYLDRILFDELERVNPEEAYRRIYQSNSSALYFAQCQHPQETWLPLLEKCYAKAHGDYAAIEGGFGGEGIEDLTGGVTSELYTADILDKEYFWKELLQVNQEFLFGCSADVWGLGRGEAAGILDRHAYSVQRSIEIDGQRLLLLKNPWGKGEWKGAWSDGSQEWTSEWLEKLNHKFGDDGEFWISYGDLLRKFQAFDRTRLFDSDWQVAQIWTTLVVPWTVDYHDTHFSFSIAKSGPVVIVLSQLDDRYFRGLEGQYHFELAFRLHRAGREDYLVRSQTPYRMSRSVNVDLTLEEGDYQVLIKVVATRRQQLLPLDKVIRNNAKSRRHKLIRIGLSYDLAHGKGQYTETTEEKAKIDLRLRQEEDKKRQQARKRFLTRRQNDHYLKQKKSQREKQRLNAKKLRQKHRKERLGAAPTEDEASQTPLALYEGAGPSEAVLSRSPDTMLAMSETFNAAGKSQKQGTNGPKSLDSLGSEDLEDIDSLSELSERELDLHVDTTSNDAETKKEENVVASTEDFDTFEIDPWNAAVVVGLRVYHRTPQEADSKALVNLKVIRPSHLDEVGDEKVDKTRPERRATGLDVDDSAKDATLVGGVKERKKSILGDVRQGGQVDRQRAEP